MLKEVIKWFRPVEMKTNFGGWEFVKNALAD